MYPILFCSVVAVAVILERLIFYLWTKENYKNLLDGIKQHILSKNIDGANHFTGKRHTALGRIALLYLNNIHRERRIFEDLLFQKGSKELKSLEQRLSLLAVIGHLTPLMGLLGTALGMITCFQQIESSGGQADVNALAGGIWVALLTTAFGLIIAIPVMATYHFFENLVNDRSDKMQQLISELNDMFDIHSSARKKIKNNALEKRESDYETVHTS